LNPLSIGLRDWDESQKPQASSTMQPRGEALTRIVFTFFGF